MLLYVTSRNSNVTYFKTLCFFIFYDLNKINKRHEVQFICDIFTKLSEISYCTVFQIKYLKFSLFLNMLVEKLMLQIIQKFIKIKKQLLYL